MKKILFVLLSVIITFVQVKSQEEEDSEKYRFSIGLTGGIVQNINAYRTLADGEGFTYYGDDLAYSVGLDMGLFVTNKIRTRLELKYLEMEYGMDWNYTNSDFYKTTTSLFNVDVNLYCDYLALSLEHLQLFVSLGIINEFVYTHEFKNILSDGEVNYKSYNVLSNQYPETISGGDISLIVKYKINNNIGITLNPGYTYFFRKFVRDNDDPYQRTNVNLGVEYTF